MVQVRRLIRRHEARFIAFGRGGRSKQAAPSRGGNKNTSLHRAHHFALAYHHFFPYYGGGGVSMSPLSIEESA